jgi:4-hydroxybenzoate polyprenyltransferase/phosphoserine phosphatase
VTTHLPLIVDLDGTLLRTDTLVENFAAAIFARPARTAVCCLRLYEGRPGFKRRLAADVELDIEALPVREDLLEFLHHQRQAGREVHLVTATDQRIADRIAAHFDVFDSATGTSTEVNLKGANKQAYLRERFPEGYVYAGDSRADLKVWQDADAIILAGASPGTTRAAGRLGKPVERSFENEALTTRVWRKALRLHQWAKNLLVFAPLLLSGLYYEPAAILAAILAFFALGLVASGTYLLNDLADLPADRRHRSKRFRPMATGALPVWIGMIAAPVLILAGLLLGLFVNLALVVALAAYLATTLSYSFGLKRKPVVDVMILAALFTLRLLIGVAAIGAAVSFWLLSFSMFFFLSLSMAKRHVEIAAAEPGRRLNGRGYTAEDGPFSLGVGLSSGMAAIVILCLYVTEDAMPVLRYSEPGFLWVVPVVIGSWVLRIWLLAHRGELDDDPVAFAVGDRISLALGVVLAVAFAAASFL